MLLETTMSESFEPSNVKNGTDSLQLM